MRYDTSLKNGKFSIYFGGEYGDSNAKYLYEQGKRESGVINTLDTQEIGALYKKGMHNLALNIGRYDKRTFGINEENDLETTKHDSAYIAAGYTMQRELLDIGFKRNLQYNRSQFGF